MDLVQHSKPEQAGDHRFLCYLVCPCWNYHTREYFEELTNEFGPNGSDDIMVFFIEADLSTNTACLYGPNGCGWHPGATGSTVHPPNY